MPPSDAEATVPSSRKIALVTGITGQDGSYLAELLLSKGYEVHGLIRRASTFNTERLDRIYQDPHDSDVRLRLHYGDLHDGVGLVNLMRAVHPDEVYHLGAQSHVKVSFEMPDYTGDVTGVATIRLLEAIRASGISTRFYQASSSEMFGSTPPPQNEQTPFHPRSPYGAAKVYGYWVTVNYRESYGMYACNGILFNHEGPTRGESFVTRKITIGVSQIALGKLDVLLLGNLDAKRDWGHAKDYAEGMWLMMQQEVPEDYVLATGITTSVRDFVKMAFGEVGIELVFEGAGVDEKAFISKCNNPAYQLPVGKQVVGIHPRYFRPAEVDLLIGDATKAQEKLGWKPKYDIKSLVKEMMASEIVYQQTK